MYTEDLYKERFVKEYNELKEQFTKLDKALTQDFPFAPACPLDLLQKQLLVMNDYLHILEKRAKIEGVQLK